MAHIKYVYLHSHDWDKSQMSVSVTLKPAGSAELKVPVPVRFYAALMKLAQTAADAHEAQMRAEILGDETVSEVADQHTS